MTFEARSKYGKEKIARISKKPRWSKDSKKIARIKFYEGTYILNMLSIKKFEKTSVLKIASDM